MFYFPKLFKKQKLKLIVISSISLFLIILFILLKGILFKDWLDYPSELRAKIAFSKWQASFNDDCYGQCLIDRQVLREIFLDFYKSDKEMVLEILKNDFLESVNDDYSLAIIKTLKDLNYSLSNKWRQLEELNISLKAKQFLVKHYPADFKDNLDLKEKLEKKIDDNLVKLEDKLISLAILSIYDSNDVYIAIILGNYPLSLKKTALKNISDLSEQELNILAEALINNNFDLSLSSNLVWLISDYYQKHPQLVSQYLSQVYQSKTLDVFARGYAALALNELLKANLRLPKVESLEWQEYYRYY